MGHTPPMKLDRLHITLGLLLSLGVAFRAAHEHSRKPDKNSAASMALDRQIGQVAQKRAATSSKRPPKKSPKPKATQPKSSVARVESPRAENTPPGALPALSVRVLNKQGKSSNSSAKIPATLRVNLDLANASAIESLPRIGPALAERIVQDRAAHGPFGSLGGLDRVKGVGPALQKAIAPYVTFSSSGRPSGVATVPQPAQQSGKGKARRRPPAGAAR